METMEKFMLNLKTQAESMSTATTLDGFTLIVAAALAEYMSTAPEVDEFMLIAAVVEECTLTVMATGEFMWIAMAMEESMLTTAITEESTSIIVTVVVVGVMSIGTDADDRRG